MANYLSSMYLTPINTGEYEIASGSNDITVTKMADGITWEVTRTTASVLKEVSLIINCGREQYIQTIVLSN